MPERFVLRAEPRTRPHVLADNPRLRHPIGNNTEATMRISLQRPGCLDEPTVRGANNMNHHANRGQRLRCQKVFRHSCGSAHRFEALLRIEAFSVHPVTRSVIVNVRANSPVRVGPQ